KLTQAKTCKIVNRFNSCNILFSHLTVHERPRYILFPYTTLFRSKTIIEKIWDKHIVHEEEGKPDLIYIDLLLIHEGQYKLNLVRSEEHTSELQSRFDIVCRLLLEKINIYV